MHQHLMSIFGTKHGIYDDMRNFSLRTFLYRWLVPFALAAGNGVLPGSAYLVVEAYTRLVFALITLSVIVIFFPQGSLATSLVFVVDTFFLARRHPIRPPRNKKFFLLGLLGIIAYVGVVLSVIAKPSRFTWSMNACGVVYHYNARANERCVSEWQKSNGSVTLRTTKKNDAECDAYMLNDVLKEGDADRRGRFRDLCYLMRAVMSNDEGYCTSSVDGAHQCMTFLAAVNKDVHMCDADTVEKSVCELASKNGVARASILKEVGTMGCDKEGFGKELSSRCASAFGVYFDGVHKAYSNSLQ